MGSSASKGARKLPTTAPSTIRPPPSWAGARTPHPEPISTESASSSTNVESSRFAPDHSSSTPNPPLGRSQPGFSGEKDDAIRRDSLDPHFASNLSRLGQVSIHDAGKFMPTPSAAQRTLSARRDEFTNASVTPPAGHLTAPSLISLLDRVKALPITGDRRRVYEEYGVDRGMDEVRRWVNSPSVGRVDVVKVVDGEEVREMHAIWVDSSDSVPSLPPTRPMASPMPKS